MGNHNSICSCVENDSRHEVTKEATKIHFKPLDISLSQDLAKKGGKSTKGTILGLPEAMNESHSSDEFDIESGKEAEKGNTEPRNKLGSNEGKLNHLHTIDEVDESSLSHMETQRL